MSQGAEHPSCVEAQVRRVALVRGNPRKEGFTQRCADLILTGLREVGAEVVEIDLAEQEILTCLGCYHCWLAAPGRCVHEDAMATHLEVLRRSDVWVMTTPIYFFSMSALLKAFLERLFPLAQPGLVESAAGRLRNRTRYSEGWQGKTMVTLMVGALRDPGLFRPVCETFELIADTLALEIGGQLVRPESYLMDYLLSKPVTLQRVRAALVEAGREIGRTGRVSKATGRTVSLPISADESYFRTYSNIYWSKAVAMGEVAMDPAEVEARVATDVEILLREMVRTFNPKVAGRLRARLQFELSHPDSSYQVRIAEGECRLEAGCCPEPDLVIRCDVSTWVRIFTRVEDVREALRSRKLVLEGDKALFGRLERLFPPPSV